MDARYAGTADSTGALTITVQPRSSAVWTVYQVSLELIQIPGGAAVPGAALCNVRKNGFLVSPAVAQGDAVGGQPPIDLQPTDVLTVEWTNAAAGNVGHVLVIFDQKAA